MDEYTCTTLFFYHADRHINHVTKETHNPEHAIKDQKMGRGKFLFLAFDKFGFLNFMNINIEKFAGTNFAIVVTETLYF